MKKLLVAGLLAPLGALADITVPTPPDVAPIVATGTTIFQTAATLGLTVLGLGVVIGAVLAGLRMGKKRVG